MSLESRIVTVMSEVLDVPVSQIGAATSVDTVASWDSMHGMMLVVGLEEEFCVHFSDQEIFEMVSFDIIRLTLMEKGVS